MRDKWASLVDRECRTCGSSFKVQFQTTKRPNGGLFCKRTCDPNYNKHLDAFVASPLGSNRSEVAKPCATCGKTMITKVRNISRGGGMFCSRACNPAYAKKFTYAEKIRRHNLRRNYGITVDDFDAMKKAQKGRCKICGDEPERLFVDHDHQTGAVRDLLCQGCNFGLGHLRDDPNNLAAGLLYLIKHATGQGNANKDAMIEAVKARGFKPQDDNEADAIALLLWATEGKRA